MSALRLHVLAVAVMACALIAPAAATAAAGAPDPSLKAAFGFEEGSGGTVADASANGNVGTIAGASWTTAGRFGNALSFDGVNDLVTVPDADSLDFSTAMTLEAWVRPTELTRYRSAIMKEAVTALAYALYPETSRAQPAFQVQMEGKLRGIFGPTQLPANVWTHVAATFDGNIFRLFINGAEVAIGSRRQLVTMSTGPLRIGGTLIYPEWFKGEIDEVRLYNRALTAGEVQLDMNTQVSAGPDDVPPTQPGAFTATGTGPASVSTSWTASTDDRGVDRYHLFANGQPAGTTTSTTFTFEGLNCSTQYELGVEARDAAGNPSPRSTLTASTTNCDTTKPAVSLTAPASGVTVSGTISVIADATDNDAVAQVQMLLDGQPLGDPDTAAPWSVAWNTRSAANGSHQLTARATDRSGNVETSTPVTVTVENTTAPPPTGLVAGFGFDEGAGTTVADASNNGNHGTITAATWTPNGRIGAALEFDGSAAMVSVPDSDTLDLTTGMTLSAWLRPDVLNGAWRTVIFKERPGNLAYALYAQDNTPVPAGEMTIGSAVTNLRGTTQLPLSEWTHLTYTYDGTTQRMFLNGVPVSSAPRSGPIVTSTGALRIGGNGIWGERFDGLIDEVRVYNRALPQAEIEADMATSVGEPDGEPPSTPTGVTATGSVGRVTLGWTASTDNVGVTHYDVHRGPSADFIPSDANRVGQPTTTGYVDSGLAAGTYHYKIRAADRGLNLSPPSAAVSGTTLPDTEQPSVSLTAPTAGATVSGAINVTASATDNDAVAGVQFLLDGQPLGSEDTSAPYSVSWNSRLVPNGPYTLSARARDGANNQRTSTGVGVNVDNTNAPPPGLVAGYGFDDGTGDTVADASGNGNAGTIRGARWVPIGRMGGALDFDGIDDWITIPDAGSLDLTTGMTISTWLRPDVIGTAWRTAIFKERTGNLVYGIYANTNTSVPNGEITIGTAVRDTRGTSKVPDGTWTHLAATYDGAQLRLFMNGTQVSSLSTSGPIATSTGALRIGGNSIWGEYFDGVIDEVRVYDRALTGGEIAVDMATGVAGDSKAPTVTEISPDAGAQGVGVGPAVTATFSEAMDPASITTSTFALRDPANAVVPATVTFNANTGKATLRSTTALRYGTTYTATVEGGASGARVKDMAGNALAADRTWSFTTEAAPPPILVVDSPSNPFSSYVPEIMRAEGINGFSVNDVSLVDAGYLANFDVVILGDVPVTAAQVTALSNWVAAGGNLIALSPDKQLAGLLGLIDSGTTLSDAYLRVSTAGAPGAGIVGESMQFHGTADRYTLNGATAVATLYSNANTPTSSPAVTLRSVGAGGGEAAAFMFDLARSTSLTRQGNPAFAGLERDGFNPIRTNDLFFGATESNWVDLSKIHIPQADELQRLFANLVTHMNRDRTPVPRFWYLPRGEKAAIVMTGDDHADGGSAGRFNQYILASPPNCSVQDWECARMTSYVYPNSPLTNAQAAQYESEGFEVSVHPSNGGCLTKPTFATLNTLYTTRLAEFAASYPSVPRPTTSRFHCVSWPDWSSHAKVQAAHGIRMDTNYYHFPPSWAGFPGFMTGSGLMMKFADLDGTTIDLYQSHTHLNDEAMDTGAKVQFAVDSLLDRATGPEGYYGLFDANMHTDEIHSAGSDAIVASAQARDVPIISARQALRWVDGRNGSSFRDFTWSAGRLGFTIAAAPGSNGIEGMLPILAGTRELVSVTHGGSDVGLTVRTVKGVPYAVFGAADGRYEAVYE